MAISEQPIAPPNPPGGVPPGSAPPVELDAYYNPDDPTKPLPPELWPEVDHLVTEDDTPVDNMYSEKQMRLLTEPLYACWPGPGNDRPFLVTANVGLFYSAHEPAIVPDVLLSLDVKPRENLLIKRHRSYFIWEFGKPPDAIIEIVSNRVGDEFTRKAAVYATLGAPYYIVWDPDNLLDKGTLNIFALREKEYQPLADGRLPVIGLELVVWHGIFENVEADWLRWRLPEGNLIPTGAERAEQERQRADRLAAQLRALGIEPE
ncbi:MAG: Uma2 family endonuclease [Planctomycetes bacterium]|nr:Uma2 family endonuclease [Planctomycetota bacterium]